MIALVIVLLLAGIFLVMLEAILPGGILGLIGWAAIAGSAYLCVQRYGWGVGGAYLGGSFVAAIVAWGLTFRYVVPLLALDPYEPREGGDESAPAENSLTGKTGRALNDLDPTGRVEIDGKRREARGESSTAPIAKGSAVEVVDVDGMYLVVREKI